MVTVTDARLTPDLREATVFYTVWGDDNVRQDTAHALESAKGVIRSAVGRGTEGALVVAMTGYGQDEDRQRSRAAGFDAHLVKPIDLDALQELLARSG